jgi:hypothetical protein
MTVPASTVFLIDVDNTLLDNDAVEADFHRHLAAQFGQDRAERYWTIFEELRNELAYADYLGALQRLRGAYRTSPTCSRPRPMSSSTRSPNASMRAHSIPCGASTSSAGP